MSGATILLMAVPLDLGGEDDDLCEVTGDLRTRSGRTIRRLECGRLPNHEGDHFDDTDPECYWRLEE